jgi:chromosome segregation ATPase
VEQELLALLKQHEEAARRRVEELRVELAALNEQIAAAEGELSDLVVTQATLARVLAERDAGEPEFEQVSVRDAVPDDLTYPLPPVVRIGTGEVPAEGDWPVLALLARVNTPLRAKEICEVTEEVADHRHVETLRMRLKRMVRGEWLAEPSRGLFTLADGVRAPDRP